MEAYETLEAFIASDECKEALEEIITHELVTKNLERVKHLLPKTKDELVDQLAGGLVNELAEQNVRHRSIPEDNHEAMILMVGELESVEFSYDKLAHYGDADIGIPFRATVECELNHRIYRSTYYSLDDDRDVSVSEWSDHYLDAEEYYQVAVEGEIAILIDDEDLRNDDLSDDDIENIITSSAMNTEVYKIRVIAPRTRGGTNEPAPNPEDY